MDLEAGVTETTIQFQQLRDTALTRIAEAKVLLTQPMHKRDRRDGALTCALLAAECALKAVLLYDQGKTRAIDLAEGLRKAHFTGTSGHSLHGIRAAITGALTGTPEAAVEQAIGRLGRQKRYELRYGQTRPKGRDAQPLVEDAQTVVQWMKVKTQ